jgi:C1A family cysteine protease
MKKINLPAKVDLRPQMTPVQDQGHLGSSTAFAVCAAIEAENVFGNYVFGAAENTLQTLHFKGEEKQDFIKSEFYLP